MKERNIAINIDNEDKDEHVEYACKATIGFAFNIDETEENTVDSAFFVGTGDTQVLLVKAAMQLGELTRTALTSEVDTFITGAAMIKKFIEAVSGNCKDFESTTLMDEFTEEKEETEE